MPNPRLELTWIGKENRPRLEPRILLEDPTKSHHAKHRTGKKDIFDNRLIFGDNLLALKALEQEFTGKVKCIYIDPPYNTGNAFEHYDDGLEHSIWLGLMRDRLELLYRLLSKDGSIWISIDENELHYLKIICDEIFGRRNFIIQTTIQRGAATGHKAINPTPVQISDFMLTYAKDKDIWNYQPVYAKRDYDKAYSSFILNYEEPFESWKFISLKEALKNKGMSIEDCIQKEPERIIRFAQPSYDGVGKETKELIDISKSDSSKIYRQIRTNHPDIYLYKGNRILFYKDKLKTIDGKYVTAELVTNLWTDMNYQGIAREGGVNFPKGKKPEAQIKRILEMSTNPGDLVLDSFAGSGTTGAVAHKMGRRWIMIELGEHCHTHIIPRLKKVIDGEDSGGITEAAGWKGGGGFRYYRLAPSLLQKDKWDNWIINKEYNPEMLAEAVCKLEGFTYAPSDSIYWIHGTSTENDYIYVTTAQLTHDQLALLSDEVGNNRTLLVMCTAFRSRAGGFPNLTVKKIPASVLSKCEWGHDDYSLQIENLPMREKVKKPQPDLFEEEESANCTN
jgi:adenine-specific DNA-methyltransferase